MVVLIIAIISITSLLKGRFHSRQAIADDRDGRRTALPRSNEAELEREIADLRKRLAVLERIATDDRQSQAIAHEIEQLRDR